MKHLHLADGLQIPLDVVTEKLAWIGVTGSGKSYGASKLAELLWAERAQFVVLDPVGVWWGLRLAKDGNGAGIPVPVFGGLHGDVPLEPTGGALVADLIVDRDLSAVLDVSQFDSDAQKARFVSDFAERFFHRKKASPSAVHLFLEEAQEFVPQNPQRGEEMMLHRLHRLQKLGRNFGIGTSIITQRPQETSKKALNQAQTVFAFRLTGSQERKAVETWIEDKGLDQDLVADLPKIETGHCHVWSPAWLRVSKMFHIAVKHTFDASATPKVGELRAARELAPIDLERIRKDMAATIEKAKSEDPKALREKVRKLNAELLHAKAPIKIIQERAKEKRVEVPILKEADIKRLESALEKGRKVAEASVGAMLAVTKLLEGFRPTTVLNPTPAPAARGISLPPQTHVLRADDLAPHARPDDISRPQQRILDAIAQLVAWNVNAPDRRQVALLAEQSPSSSGYEKNCSTLKTMGLVHYPGPGFVSLTPEGGRRARQLDGASGESMRNGFLSRVSRPQAEILKRLIEHYPHNVARNNLAEIAGQSATSSGYEKNLSTLKSLGVITYPERGLARAADVLFIGGA